MTVDEAGAGDTSLARARELVDRLDELVRRARPRGGSVEWLLPPLLVGLNTTRWQEARGVVALVDLAGGRARSWLERGFGPGPSQEELQGWEDAFVRLEALLDDAGVQGRRATR